MSSEKKYDSNEAGFTYGDDGGFEESAGPRMQKRKKPVQGRKRGKAPSSFNGMHRRRRRKMAW